MSGSFVNRQLRASLTLPQGVFPGTNSNTLVLSGLRMSVRLEQSGNFTNSCELRIWGMRQVDMSAVTTVFAPQNFVPYDPVAQAIVTLEVLPPSATAPLTIFSGQFFEAMPDYRAAPEVCLHAQALTGYAAQLTAEPPSSYQGSVDVVAVATQLAKSLGFVVVPNDAQAQVNSPYLSGSQMDKLQSILEAGGIDYYFDASGKKIKLLPRNKGQQGIAPVPVNRSTGLVSYPTLQRFGIEVTTLFNPAIELGAPIQVSDSQVPGCDGLFFPFAMAHELETIKPDGRWFSTLQCMPFRASA